MSILEQLRQVLGKKQRISYSVQQLVNETLNNTKHPRWGEWECSYCIFNIMCPFKKINSYNRRR